MDVTSDGSSFIVCSALNTKLDAKLVNDAGMGYANAADSGGTSVTFNRAFVDVSAIDVTPSGTTSVSAVYDFTDVPNPTGFKVLLFNSVTGARVSGNFSWSAKGY